MTASPRDKLTCELFEGRQRLLAKSLYIRSIYSEKATKFYEIFTNYLSYVSSTSQIIGWDFAKWVIFRKHYLRFGLVNGRQAVLKISVILLKHPKFEGGSLLLCHGQNRYKIRCSVHCSVRTKSGILLPIVRSVKGQNNFWSKNVFLTFSWRFLRSNNRLEQFKFKLENIIGI